VFVAICREHAIAGAAPESMGSDHRRPGRQGEAGRLTEPSRRRYFCSGITARHRDARQAGVVWRGILAACKKPARNLQEIGD